MFRSKEKRQQPPRKGRQNMLNFVSTYLLTVYVLLFYIIRLAIVTFVGHAVVA